MKPFFAALVTVFAFIGVYLYFYLKVSSPVIVHGVQSPSFSLLYQTHIGPYHKINEALTEVEQWAEQKNRDCSLTFGRFLDDPHSVEHDRLRSQVGCLSLLPNYFNKNTEPYSNAQLPSREYLVLEFQGSPSLGPLKVYPKATQWLEANNRTTSEPVIETYKVHDDSVTTQYFFPLNFGNLRRSSQN